MVRTYLCLILLFGFSVLSAQEYEKKEALILIDIQEFYFDTTRMPLEGNLEAAGKASLILNSFRERGLNVVHVVHKGGGEIHPLLKPLENETIFVKEEVNAFLGTGLLNYLGNEGITHLVLAGMQTHMCLEAATRAAADYGYNCIVIADACATRDLQYEGTRVKAEDVHAATLAALKAYAKIMNAAEYLSNP